MFDCYFLIIWLNKSTQENLFYLPFKYQAQTALFKDPVRTAQ